MGEFLVVLGVPEDDGAAIVFQLHLLELRILQLLELFEHFGQLGLIKEGEVEVASVELLGHLDLDAGLDFEPVDVDRLLSLQLQTLALLAS